ncbi:MAG: hypothetical protein KIS67_28000 [Verrucomicrobiae bacterium]|nr:hypothetical protein [Verrucomicrobiae bacterium]
MVLVAAVLCALEFLPGTACAAQRGRPTLNAARTTFVADNGELLRGAYTSTEWTSAAPATEIANMRNLGFNAPQIVGDQWQVELPVSVAPATIFYRLMK